MPLGYYPRIETILVPLNISANDIGKYATTKATEILTEIGPVNIHQRSNIILSAVSERFFTLRFDTINGYSMPKEKEANADIQASGLDSAKREAVGPARMALRSKGGHTKGAE